MIGDEVDIGQIMEQRRARECEQHEPQTRVANPRPCAPRERGDSISYLHVISSFIAIRCMLARAASCGKRAFSSLHQKPPREPPRLRVRRNGRTAIRTAFALD